MTPPKNIRGKVWRFDDNVDTDQIIPAKYLITGDPKELGKHAFENVRAEFVKNVRAGDMIVAGENFGCGSSREHAPRALMGVGVSCVVAESFARIFYRNSINIGFPVIECKADAKEGDELVVDFEAGKVRNLSSSKEYGFKPLPPFILKLIDAGGLVGYVKQQLRK
jgi:3-isopropylmalate/(R)-2-methylmalate dehydratase small subunit